MLSSSSLYNNFLQYNKTEHKLKKGYLTVKIISPQKNKNRTTTNYPSNKRLSLHEGCAIFEGDILYICTKAAQMTNKLSGTMDSPDELYRLHPNIVGNMMKSIRATTYTSIFVDIHPILVKDFIMGVERYDFSNVKKLSKFTDKNIKTNHKLNFYISTEMSTGEFSANCSMASIINEGKTLINAPANICTINYFIDQIKETIHTQVTVLRQKQIIECGMGCLAAVGQGSHQEPALVVVEHKPRVSDGLDIAMVGKGIVYDTGGLSIKPSQYMYGMHTDMGGACTVLTAQHYLMHNTDVNFIAVYALAENSVSRDSYRPGDIITSLNGLTVEIKDTDAEGRLVLCDALSYVQNNYKVPVLLDIATLTGAASYVGNGRYCAIMSNRPRLRNKWIDIATHCADPAWGYPLMADLRYTSLSSQRADISNCEITGKAGHIIAGVFLQQFIDKKQDWIHVDIAGSCTDGKHMATGSPMKTLIGFAQYASQWQRNKKA